MRVGFLITARMKSTRLPKKLTLEIDGRQIIRWMIDRIKLSTVIDDIIICTSANPQDNILQEIADYENILVFRGSENDVIQRLYEASKFFNLDYSLNITADCPLVSIEYITKIVNKYEETQADFIRALDLPHGFYSYGLKIEAMQKVCEMKKSTDTEHWGECFTDTGSFKVVDLDVPENMRRPNYRLTLDYPEDYEFFKNVFDHFSETTYKKSINEIIGFLDYHPEIVRINEHCAALYKERVEKQSKIQLK